jgi:hypothetical protein
VQQFGEAPGEASAGAATEPDMPMIG